MAANAARTKESKTPLSETVVLKAVRASFKAGKVKDTTTLSQLLDFIVHNQRWSTTEVAQFEEVMKEEALRLIILQESASNAAQPLNSPKLKKNEPKATASQLAVLHSQSAHASSNEAQTCESTASGPLSCSTSLISSDSSATTPPIHKPAISKPDALQSATSRQATTSNPRITPNLSPGFQRSTTLADKVQGFVAIVNEQLYEKAVQVTITYCTLIYFQ
jgi:hypothetical protein